MTEPRAARPTVRFIDEYCESYDEEQDDLILNLVAALKQCEPHRLNLIG